MSASTRVAPAVEPETHDYHPGDSLCGYRIVRKLGEGPRAEVYLGFGASTADRAKPTTAVLKICRTPKSTSAATELEALARAAHPHVVRLVDAASLPSGAPCLLLERLSRGSLAHLIERRGRLRAGEAVTILAPIATALDAVHTSGVVHGAVGASSILFRESGSPVLARFGRASLIEPGLPPAPLATLVAADRAALAALTDLVLGCVGGADAEELAGWAIRNADSDRFGQRLAARLFDFADAEAIRFDAGASAGHTAVPSRLTAGAPLPHRVAGWREYGIGVLARVSAGTRVAAALAVARRVRTPVWVGLASLLVATIVALVVLPADADDAAARPGATREQHAASSAPPPPEPSTTNAAEPTGGDDPVVAVTAILAARAACVEQVSILCLDVVDQPGSAALDDDAALIGGIQHGGEVPRNDLLDTSGATLVERLGDSALVSLGGDNTTASVLMIRTEAGWRIRDYLEG